MGVFFENGGEGGAKGASADNGYFHKTILAQELYAIIKIRILCRNLKEKKC